MLKTQIVQGNVHVTLSLEQGVRLEHGTNEAAHIPPDPEPSVRHSQSELLEQDAARAPHAAGWHCEPTGISPVKYSQYKINDLTNGNFYLIRCKTT